MMDTVRCLSQVPYRFAKTMPNDPHYYTLRRDWNALEGFTPEVFPDLVTEMRKRETRRVYVSPSGYRGQQRYLDANGYQWWTMGAAVEETILINRAPKWYPDVECYDRVAHAYDDAYRDPGEKRISEQWFNRVHLPSGARVLDVGCGTGAFVDYRYPALHPRQYVGIDPSTGMLGVFAGKHPEYRDCLIRTTFEDYVDTERNPGFDRIVAMFGVASYVRGAMAEQVLRLLRPGGDALLIYYGSQPACNGLRGLELPFTLEPTPKEAVVDGLYAIVEIQK